MRKRQARATPYRKAKPVKTQNRRFPSLEELKAAAAGRWPEIHAALGIAPECLNPRKHCPCPYCGGRDRYRYTDFQGSGGFICNQCTPDGGSGFDLLMLVYGYDFTTAAREVAALLGFSDGHGHAERPKPRQAAKPAPTTPPKDQQAALAALWLAALPLAALPLADNDPVSCYLHTRGLPAGVVQGAANIRHAPTLPMWATRDHGGHHSRPVLIGRYPAMLAAITNTSGQLQGLHKTYLQPAKTGQGWHKLAAAHPDTGEPLPAKKMQSRHAGSLKGAAVHLGEPDAQGRLIVAEA